MNKKKLTLLIALSILIAYLLGPITVIAYDTFMEQKTEVITVEEKENTEIAVKEEVIKEPEPEPVLLSLDEIAKEVIAGKWGNGTDREKALTDIGYNYEEVQKRVDELCPKPKPSINYNYNGKGLTKRGGVFYNPKTGLKETWYSQRVLPGKGLKIPGRHVNAEGFVCDENGYICVASNDYPKGTVIETSRGMGKVYDCGCASGILDLYVNW